MKCTHCSTELSPGQKFCGECGTPQTLPGTDTQHQSGVRTGDIGYLEGNLTDASVRGAASVGNVYIGTQATDTAVICPLCGVRNLPTGTFCCRQCGQDHLCRSHLDQEQFVCVVCARQPQQASPSPPVTSPEAQFCASCGALIADRFFRCVNCQAINCGDCRDDRRRGWCVACAEAQYWEQAEKEARPQPTTGQAAKPKAAGPQHGDTLSNSLGMTFVYIAPGTFMMGSPDNEKNPIDDETRHQVTLTRGFYLQTTPVTQGQWQALMGDNPSFFKDGGPDCPVEGVSWNDVQQFIQKLNAREAGAGYGLPSEAQWEYACRAGSTAAYCFGDNIAQLDQYAWYDESAGGSTHPVGRKKPNAWGLYDMHANVWEWCADWHGEYPSDSVTDSAGPSGGSDRVLRGGSWFDNPRCVRSASRGGSDPGLGCHYLGFRLSRR